MSSVVVLKVHKDGNLLLVKQFDQNQVIIGSGVDSHIMLDDSKVSSIHCMIEKRQSGFFICDLGSKQGTIKNGKTVLDEKIESGDEINIGKYKIEFSVGAPKGAQNSEIPESKSSEHSANSKNQKNEIPKRPTIKSTNEKGKKAKNKKTFAPQSEIADLKSYLKPKKGPFVEVLIAWKERIIGTHHLRNRGIYKVSAAGGITIPKGIIAAGWPLIEVGQVTRIQLTNNMKAEVVTFDKKYSHSDLEATNRFEKSGRGKIVKLEQNEILYLSVAGSDIQIVIRNCPVSTQVPLVSNLFLSSSESAGILFSVILVALLALYVSLSMPSLEDQQTEELKRVAKVVFDKPLVKPVEVEQFLPDKREPLPEPEKVKISNETKDQTVEGRGEQKGVKPIVAKSASEVAPSPKINRPKKFTSVQQGGSVKSSKTAGATDKSEVRDVSKLGLFAAFGGGGTRSKLNKAYSGAGDISGLAEKATGSAGQNESRAGDDIGSKFKDVGAGGKGTATHGISGVGTKGRGGGTSAYGSEFGFGNKTSVTIQPGGAEEQFDGTIDKEAIRRVIRERLREIRACYERVLNTLPKGQRLEGRVVMSWEILEKGHVRAVKIKSSELKNSTVESCMKSRLSTWNFPEPPKGMIAEVQAYPFYFKSDN